MPFTNSFGSLTGFNNFNNAGFTRPEMNSNFKGFSGFGSLNTQSAFNFNGFSNFGFSLNTESAFTFNGFSGFNSQSVNGGFSAFSNFLGFNSRNNNSVSLTSNKALNALALAKSQIGVREATGNNDGAQINEYRNGSTARTQWCASFASWCFGRGQGSNNSKTFGYEQSSQAMRVKAEKAGYYSTLGSGYVPKPGDIAIWKKSASTGHVGIVEKVNADGSYTIIEGNCGDAVQRMTRRSSDANLHGFIRMNEWLEA